MEYQRFDMTKPSRSAIKTLTINRSRDIVVDKIVKECLNENHSKCTGWAVLKREHSPINANYFLRCTCSCHRKGAQTKSKPAAKKRVKKTSRPARKARKAKKSKSRRKK